MTTEQSIEILNELPLYKLYEMYDGINRSLVVNDGKIVAIEE